MTTATSTASSPKWIVIYLWITSAMALLFSLLAYAKPEVQFGTWPAMKTEAALSLAGPLGLYIARNLATVAAVFVSLLSGQAAAIRTALVLRAVTDSLDGIHNAVSGNLPAAGFAAVMFAIEAFALTRMRASA